MKILTFYAALICAAVTFIPPALADSTLFVFKGAIGSQPLRAGGLPNTIAGIAPGGTPWPIESFKAEIKADGSLIAKGKGLLLGGGDTVGARGGIRQVVASLFCRNAPVAPAVTGTLQTNPYNSEPVDLDENGDFKINNDLINGDNESPNADCGDSLDNRPVLLIRAFAGNPAAPGPWFAAGIIKN